MINFADKRPLKSLRDCGVRTNICDVYKIARDVAKSFNDKHGFHIRTQSDVNNGWVICKDGISAFLKSKFVVLVFNGESASNLRALGYNAHTITTYTGSRDHTVVLYIDSAAVASQLNNRSSYIYTAASRATHQLVIAGDTDYISKYYQLHGAKVMTYEEIAGVYAYHNIEQKLDDSFAITVPRELAKDSASAEVAATILSELYTPVNDPEGIALSINKAAIAPIEDGKLSTPTDAVMNIDESARGYKVQPMRYAKHQVSNSTIEAVQTLAKRYARGYTQRADKRNTEFALTELLSGLSQAIYGKPDKLSKLKNDLRVTNTYLSERYLQYVDAAQLKFNSNPGASRDVTTEFDFDREKLEFFNKRQTKHDPKPAFDTSDKVGQGVAATSKRMNFVFAAYARSLLDRIREILAKSERDIILATHDSEAGINDVYTMLSDKHGPQNNFACNDFSEWDSSFRSCFASLTCRLLEFMGCPQELVDDFEKYRSSWTMTYQHKYGTTTLKGHEKQFSGNPFTICENTLGNMALCFAIFRYDGFKYALFKGDDSAVACDSCVITEKGARLLGFTGHGLKLHNSPIGEFAGWFLTDCGLFPDAYRYTAKFLDKVYRDQEHFNEALMSLQERCSAVKNDTQLRVGSIMCALYYKGIFGPDARVSDEDVRTLFNFLRNSRQIRFDQLYPVNLPMLHFDKPNSV